MPTSTNRQPKRDFCFIIMSFGNNPSLQDHYEHAIKPVVEACGLDCIRTDELEYNSRITDKVISLIEDATFIIADLTEERPNCYYELGYAHALKRTVIHIANERSKIHFDVKDYNFIVYARLTELKERLQARIEATLSSKPNELFENIIEAIDRYEAFSEQHKIRMLRKRVTKYPVQNKNDDDKMLEPLNDSLEFHVKNGLLSQGNPVIFKKEDGGLYYLKAKKKGWGHIDHTHDFKGLIECSKDIDILIARIKDAFDAFLAKK